MIPDATTKGLIVLGIKKYIHENHGRDAWEKLLGFLTPEERDLIGPTLMTVSRVPAGILSKIYEGIKKTCGQGRGDYYSKIMSFIAEENLNSVMRFFLKVGSPGLVANTAPAVWKHIFTSGKMVKVGSSEHAIDLEVLGGEAYGESLCYAIIGWGRKALELAGAKDLRVDHGECIYHGKARCLFRVQWK